jgi:hypothetical protein
VSRTGFHASTAGVALDHRRDLGVDEDGMLRTDIEAVETPRTFWKDPVDSILHSEDGSHRADHFA